ncbi:hypothetical protein RHIZ404_220270 [Rhizobium sp. EC-SD404]|nr:hypothetical protein RHIZ404_220270 [Rhizobium sp. EC-SD404]
MTHFLLVAAIRFPSNGFEMHRNKPSKRCANSPEGLRGLGKRLFIFGFRPFQGRTLLAN